MSENESAYQKKRSVQLQFQSAFNINDYEAVAELLDEGNEFRPNIDEKLISNYPVFISLCEDNLPMLNVLFTAGANLDVANEYGWHFSHELVTKNPKLVKKILPHVSLAVNTPDGTTPLMVAVEKELWETVDILLSSENSLRVYSVNSNGDSAAHLLAKHNQIALLQKLIDFSEDSHEAFLKNNDGKTPFDFIENEQVREMLEEKVNVVALKFNGTYVENISDLKVTANEPISTPSVEGEVAESSQPVVEKPKVKKMGLGGIKKNF